MPYKNPNYLADYMAKRRSVAIAQGICAQCLTDQAAPGKKRCNWCLEYDRDRPRRKRKIKA